MMLEPLVKLRFYECLCLAGDYKDTGELPTVKKMSYIFRISEKQLIDELEQLKEAGITGLRQGIWWLVNYEKRQAPMSGTERQRRRRDKLQKEQYYGNGGVTKAYAEVEEEVEIEKEIEKEVDVDKKNFNNGLILCKTFSKVSKLPYSANKKAEIQMLNVGVMPKDIAIAWKELEQKRKEDKRFKMPASVSGIVKPAIYAMQDRVNNKGSPGEDILHYAEERFGNG